MPIVIYDQGGKVCALPEDVAESVYRAGYAVPGNRKKATNKLQLVVSRRQFFGFIRGDRGITSPKTWHVEHVGEDRSRLYQHDHVRCNGYADTLVDCLV